MKLDDDTYPIIENILDSLKYYDYVKPFYLGRVGGSIIKGNKTLFCSGGAGYILSQGALRQIQSRLALCSQVNFQVENKIK